MITILLGLYTTTDGVEMRSIKENGLYRILIDGVLRAETKSVNYHSGALRKLIKHGNYTKVKTLGNVR